MALKNNSTPIYDITPMTMLDYQDQLACIVWFSGCSMSCSYCYNPLIVTGRGTKSTDYLFDFLKKRKGLLDGVVLSGGECTLFAGIVDLCRQIKDMGFLIKIDTNGTKPDVIKRLLDLQLIDYIALDYKAPQPKFDDVTGTNKFTAFSKTLNILLEQDRVKFEVRTTVHSALLNESDINSIITDLSSRKYDGTYYLQKSIIGAETLKPLKESDTWLDLEQLSDALPLEIRKQ